MRTSNNPALTRSPAFTEQGLRDVDPLEEAYAKLKNLALAARQLRERHA